MSTTVKQALELAETKPSKLTISFNGKQYSNDEKVPKAESTTAPKLSLINAEGSGTTTYVAICLDLDAPYVTAAFLSPVLHWIQTDLKWSSSGDLESETPSLVDWLAPAPPPLSGPHRYLFMLYEQPDGFAELPQVRALKDVSVMGRLRDDIDGFVKETGLKDMVAATWFENA